MYDVHYWPTPNGKKVTILLEELGVPYRVVPVNIGRGDQFTAEFLRMNPNHRMPVLVDTAPADRSGGGGAPIAIFESGAIMQYLAEKHGRFLPADTRGRTEVMQWVFWQMANQGPKLGECGHFRRLGDTKGDQSYAVRRFTDEANRLYGVLNNALHSRRYLAGDTYTIADMDVWGWARLIPMALSKEAWEKFPHLKRLVDEIEARPAAQAAIKLKDRFTFKTENDEEARRNMFRHIKA